MRDILADTTQVCLTLKKVPALFWSDFDTTSMPLSVKSHNKILSKPDFKVALKVARLCSRASMNRALARTLKWT